MIKEDLEKLSNDELIVKAKGLEIEIGEEPNREDLIETILNLSGDETPDETPADEKPKTKTELKAEEKAKKKAEAEAKKNADSNDKKKADETPAPVDNADAMVTVKFLILKGTAQKIGNEMIIFDANGKAQMKAQDSDKKIAELKAIIEKGAKPE